MEVNINKIASNITYKNGIYYANELSKISYPIEGNDACFELEDNSFWFNHRNNCIIELIKKFSNNQIFFDIGGGNGYFSLMLQKQGINSVLVEPGLVGCLNGQKRGVNYIVNSTLYDAKFEKESLDNIGVFDVVEHIEDDEAFLTENYSYLKKGGKIYITVPAYQWLFSEEDLYAGHFRRYTLKQMCQILEKIGFQVKYKSYFFSFLPLPLFLINALPYKLGIRKTKEKDYYANRHNGENKGIISKILNIFLKGEKNRIFNLKRIPFGSSCLIVAEKK